ncbi:MAG: hypothetical protein ACRBI6_11100 [Acidimicrobiales bacterium]
MQNHPRLRRSATHRFRIASVAASLSLAVTLGACSDGDTVYDDDPIPNEEQAPDADAKADGVVDGTEDGFGPATVADPEEGSDIDSDGSNEIGPGEAEN